MKNEKKDMYKLCVGDSVSFARHSDIYTEGVHFPDSEGRWIVCKNSRLMFYVNDINRSLYITLTGLPHPKCELCGIEMSFSVNGKYLTKKKFIVTK